MDMVEDLVIPVECPYDTIHVQGLEWDYPTSVILQVFSKFGPIVAANRNQQPYNTDRNFMYIQYTNWKAAWDTVQEFHGRHVGNQDIDVYFSERCLNVKLDNSRVGEMIWDLR